MSTSNYLDLVKIPNTPTSIIKTLTGDSEELERYKFSVKMKDVNNETFTFTSECLLNNNFDNTENILSLIQIFQNCKGCAFTMQDNNYTLNIEDNKGTLRTVQAHLTDEMIRVNIHDKNHDACKQQGYCSCHKVHQVTEMSDKQKSLTIHKRLGHIGEKQIRNAITEQWIHDIQLHKDFKSHVANCETCCLSDNRRNNRGREKAALRTSNPFEILHVDIVSCPKRNSQTKNWIELTYDGRSSTNKLTDVFPDSSPKDVTKNTFDTTHALVVTDEATRFTTIIGMRSKNVTDVKSAFKHLFQLILPQLRTIRRQNNILEEMIVRVIHSDDDSTISISNDLNAYWRSLNIKFEPTERDHPYHNGVVERTIGVLKTHTRKLLIEAKLPPTFWIFAFNYAAMIRNATGVKTKGKVISPMVELLGETTSYKTLQKFGQVCYVLDINEQKKNKDALIKRCKGIFLGYHEMAKPNDGGQRKAIIFIPLKWIDVNHIESKGYVTGKLILTAEIKFLAESIPEDSQLHLENKMFDFYDINQLFKNWENYQEEIEMDPLEMDRYENSQDDRLTKVLTDLRQTNSGFEATGLEYPYAKLDENFPSSLKKTSHQPHKSVKEDAPNSLGEEPADNNQSDNNSEDNIMEGDYPQKQNLNVEEIEVRPAVLNHSSDTDVKDARVKTSNIDNKVLSDQTEVLEEQVQPNVHSPEIMSTDDEAMLTQSDNEQQEINDTFHDPISTRTRSRKERTNLINEVTKTENIDRKSEQEMYYTFLHKQFTDIEAQGTGNTEPKAYKVHYFHHQVYKTGAVRGEQFQPNIVRKEKDVKPHEWIIAKQKELDGLQDKGTWKELDFLPKGKHFIDLKWVLKVKDNGDLKARLVARGFEQRWAKDYFDTFSAVISMNSFRQVIALTALNGWQLKQIDVSQAYLQGELKEEIFVKSDGKFYQLLKPLYGLKQAGRCWFLHVTKTLQAMKINLRQTQKDSCVFVHKDEQNTKLIVALLVDDILVAGEEEICKLFATEFSNQYQISQLEEATTFNGIEIIRDLNNPYVIKLSQEFQIRQFLNEHNAENYKQQEHAEQDMQFVLAEESNGDICQPKHQTEFRNLVGTLNWFTTGTRPDLAHLVHAASRVMQRPTNKQLRSLKKVIGYLKRYPNKPLTFDATNAEGCARIYAFSDSDFAGLPLSEDIKDRNGRKSNYGFITYFIGPTSWKSKLANNIATSTAYAETVAMFHAAKEIKSQALLLEEIGIKLHRTPLFCDNISAIQQTMGLESCKASRHVEICYSWLREQYHNHEITPFYIDTNENVADIFTKPKAKDIDILAMPQDKVEKLLKEGMRKTEDINSLDDYNSLVLNNEVQGFKRTRSPGEVSDNTSKY